MSESWDIEQAKTYLKNTWHNFSTRHFLGGAITELEKEHAERKTWQEAHGKLKQMYSTEFKEKEKWKNQAESLQKSSSFKKNYEPKWQDAYKKLEKERDNLQNEVRELKANPRSYTIFGKDKEIAELKTQIEKHKKL